MGEQIPPTEQARITQRPGILPFSNFLPFVAGAAYGLILRLLFIGNILVGIKLPSAMTAAFAIVVPIVIGAITVYLAERKARRSIIFYIFAPWLSVALFVTGAIVVLIEGSICVAMAMPLFLMLGSLGGLGMGIICRLFKNPIRTIQSISILPFLFALNESGTPLSKSTHKISRSVHISSSPQVVWRHILSPTNIKPRELEGGFAYYIGAPYPIEARLLESRLGGIRHSIWQNGVSFDEKITAWDKYHHIAWQYKFDSDSFPPGSMDDHVVIGGEYFDLDDTSYTLIPEAGGTRLDISITFRVSTGFNWYAVPMATFLISDTAETLLNLYKNRAEANLVNTQEDKRWHLSNTYYHYLVC